MTTDVNTPVEFAVDEGEFDFAELLENYDYDKPKRGDILEGVILSVSEDEVIVDVGVKRDGFVPRRDLERLDDDLRSSLVAGNDIAVYVLRPFNHDDDLIVSINKALEVVDWKRAVEMLGSEELIQGEVSAANKGGVVVNFGRLRGFVPQSQLVSVPRGVHRDALMDAKKELVGSKIPLKVIEVERERNRLILSERAAQTDVRVKRLTDLKEKEGEIVTGRVVSLVSYGVFVDLGTVDGLVHISEMDWTHVDNPGDVVEVGDEIEVRVEEVDVDRERISLSRKAAMPNPWDEILDHYAVGDLVTGTVTKAVDFGLFVELPNGLEGLVHLSQMSSYSPEHPRELVDPGDEVPVRVIEIDTERQRISLSFDKVSTEEEMAWLAERTDEDEAAAAEADATEVDMEAEPEEEAPPEMNAEALESAGDAMDAVEELVS